MNNSSIFQKAMPHMVAILSFLVVCAIYFSPQLNGKVIQAGDTASYISSSQESRSFKEKTGETTLWTNAMFGGMPTYQITAAQPTNVLQYVEKSTRLFIPRPIGYFFAMMLGFYVLMILLGVNSWLSIIGAIAFSLTTNNLVLFGAGHMTKLRTFAYFGIILAGVILAFRKKYTTGGILFALGLGVNLYANHIQMTYYFFLVLGLYGLVELVQHYRKGEMSSFGKAVLYLGIGGILAVGSSASGLWTTYEYSKDTMRGQPILEKEANVAATSSNTEGLDPGYAMQYSNNFLDLFSSFIPGVVGGGAAEPVGKNSAFASFLKSRGQAPGDDLRAPLYWGAVGKTSSTAGPVYFGAVVFFLFILGLLVVKGSIKWGIGAGVLLTMLLSMGDNFWGFNQLMFDYFPMYNKFRTPNSVLAITAFLVPVLGTLAVSEFLQGKTTKAELLKSLYIATGILGAICLFFALMGASFFELTYPVRDASYTGRGFDLAVLKSDRADLMRSDSFRSLLFILATAGLLWAFLKEKINRTILLVGIGALTVGDLWGVGRRYLGNEKFVNPRVANSQTPRPVDQQILQDTDPNFRVHDLTIDPFNNSSTSYFHKTVGGYHPAKLQRIQDVIERFISPETNRLIQALNQQEGVQPAMQTLSNSTGLNMLNTRYLILNPDGAPLRNPNAMGNAWFVDDWTVVNSANEEIDRLGTTNLRNTAVVHQEYSDYLNGYTVQKNGSMQLTAYQPNHLTYQSSSTSDQLAVFSEIWYGPDKGWQAYVDGNAVDHIRVNYLLRGLKIPSGDHKIEFKFNPSTYNIGTKITLVFSLLVLAGLIWLIFTSIQSYLNKTKSTIATASPKKTVAKKKSPLKKTSTKSKKKK